MKSIVDIEEFQVDTKRGINNSNTENKFLM